MTDNEIIKALECCNGGLDCCKECPAKENNAECGNVLKFNALNLISRQKAEIERLQAADVVEVVRCKDCKFREKIDSNYGGYCCEKIRHEIYLDDFCSYGERKELDNDT